MNPDRSLTISWEPPYSQRGTMRSRVEFQQAHYDACIRCGKLQAGIEIQVAPVEIGQQADESVTSNFVNDDVRIYESSVPTERLFEFDRVSAWCRLCGITAWRKKLSHQVAINVLTVQWRENNCFPKSLIHAPNPGTVQPAKALAADSIQRRATSTVQSILKGKDMHGTHNVEHIAICAWSSITASTRCSVLAKRMIQPELMSHFVGEKGRLKGSRVLIGQDDTRSCLSVIGADIKYDDFVWESSKINVVSTGRVETPKKNLLTLRRAREGC